jgi:phosphotransferase system HPr-like phosphotransfer protein
VNQISPAQLERIAERLWKSSRSSCADLRKSGLTVAVHNDYRLDGKSMTFWLFTAEHQGQVIALKGEGESDEEALDAVRAQWAKLTDKLHHAPMCPANHYHGKRAPTGGCTCGAALSKQAETK